MKMHGPLFVECFIEASFQENGYLLWTEGCPDAWIFDPGFRPQPDQIAAAINKRDLKPAAILVTHAHPDHIAGIEALREAFPDLPLVAPRDESHMLADARANLSAQMGLNLTVPKAEQPIHPGDTLKLNTSTWEVLDVSGHSPGGVAFYCKAAGIVFTGDALFAGGIGRTDFPGSSTQRLLDNIRRNLFTLPKDSVVYSGHGPPTTIGREAASNPFVRGGPLG